MDIQQSIKSCFKKFATFEGRASRSEFWWFQLFYMMVVLVAVILDGLLVGGNMESAGALEIVSQLMLLLPELFVIQDPDVEKPFLSLLMPTKLH